MEVDKIFNLACPASPVHYQFDPVKTTRTSVQGAINMLGLAKRLKISVLQASTSEVYGDPAVHPRPKSTGATSTLLGLAPATMKASGAPALFFDYRRQHQTAIKVARIFNTYGPRTHPSDGRVVSSFIVQALLDADITVHGDGSQTRSFCYVDDTVAALLRLMDSPFDVTGPINIGNPNEISMRELAELIIDLTGSRSRIVYRPLPQDDPCRRRPDISRAKNSLDGHLESV